jgi:hypothetical protein
MTVPAPHIDGDDVPWCSNKCPLLVYDESGCYYRCKLSERDHDGELCLPAVRDMAMRLASLVIVATVNAKGEPKSYACKVCRRTWSLLDNAKPPHSPGCAADARGGK